MADEEYEFRAPSDPNYSRQRNADLNETQAFGNRDSIGSTQQFSVREYAEDANGNEPVFYPSETANMTQSFGDDYGASTQAFSEPMATQAFDYQLEENENEAVGSTQAFGDIDVVPEPDPIFDSADVAEVTVSSTQQFLEEDYVVQSTETEIVVGAETILDADNPASPEENSEVPDERDVDEIASLDPEDDDEEILEEDGQEEGGEEAERQEVEKVDEEPEDEFSPRRRANRVMSSDNDDDAGEGPSHQLQNESIALSEGDETRADQSAIDENENSENDNRAKSNAEHSDNSGEEDEEKSEVGELMANIFGDSDDDVPSGDEEKNDGVDNENKAEGLDQDSGPDRKEMPPDFVSDFDLMMERRREENRRRYKKKKDFDIISDSDDVINEMIGQMKQAAKTDNEFNKQRKPAPTKRKLLPHVIKQLKKSDLQSAFIELGVVGAMADWLSPLPDKSLPALEIRTEVLKVLAQFPTLDHQILKSSNIGKAVMLLYKHPKETKENKERASKLISEWARPIFSLQSDYRSLTKEERIQRDYEHMPVAKRRRLSMDTEGKEKNEPEKEETPLRPGDKGWIGRARVPQPSTKDYVVRPKWNVESEFRKGGGKRAPSLMDRKIREIKERTKPKKAMRAVGVSIEGRKMAY